MVLELRARMGMVYPIVFEARFHLLRSRWLLDRPRTSQPGAITVIQSHDIGCTFSRPVVADPSGVSVRLAFLPTPRFSLALPKPWVVPRLGVRMRMRCVLSMFDAALPARRLTDHCPHPPSHSPLSIHQRIQTVLDENFKFIHRGYVDLPYPLYLASTWTFLGLGLGLVGLSAFDWLSTVWGPGTAEGQRIRRLWGLP